jgi:formamidase
MLHRNRQTGAVSAALLLIVSNIAAADTSDVRHFTPVVVEKSGDHCADDPNCFNRYHPAIPPVAQAAPGDVVVFETRDALDSTFTLDSTAEDVVAQDLNLVHPMTGPVHIEGGEPGDVLAVTLIDIEPDQYGYTVIVPGFGFLRDRFPDPFIANWKLDRLAAISDQIPDVRVPIAAFMGSVGVLPGEAETDRFLAREAQLAELGGVALMPEPAGAVPADICGPEGSDPDRCLRTIPPRENGGNMDVKQMQVGTTLLLPCFIEGCGLFVGDVHYAQGDGEVSGTAIEMGARVTVRVDLRKGEGGNLGMPHFEGGPQLKALAPSRFYATTGIPLKEAGEVPPSHTYLDGERLGPLENLSEDVTMAARHALIEMIDYMVREHGLTPQQAYVVASVAVDLRISQLVDVPNFVVSAILPLDIFVEGE